MPPPPKPGVIPLSPLQVGDVLSGAFSALGRYWKQLFGVALIAYGAAALVVVAAGALAVAAVHEHLDPVFHPPYGEHPVRSDWEPVLVAGCLVALVAIAMWLVSAALMYTAVPVVLQEAVLGRRTTFGAVWRRTWSRFPAVLGALALSWLAGLGVMVLFIALFMSLMLTDFGHGDPPAVLIVPFVLGILALIPVCVWLWVRFSFAPSAVVLENQRPVEALRRSALLVRDVWWRTCGILLLVGMISGMMGYVVQLPFTYGGILAAMPLALSHSTGSRVTAVVVVAVLYTIGMAVSQFLSTVVPQIAAGLLYVDRRIRRENLAPALAEAAAM
ncbi:MULTISPECIES: hypothetical protein [unclassified Streptomyces]|uniref:DUF7847 domain-containing protein n=1 Tax=unclassified Streptomyces TaxID=2593676 RepID=UPI0037FC0DC5